MKLTRIRKAEALKGFRLRLELTNGAVIERSIRKWMTGPIFAELRADPEKFAGVRVEHGTVTSPNGADLCPDLLIWGGPCRRPEFNHGPSGSARVEQGRRPGGDRGLDPVGPLGPEARSCA